MSISPISAKDRMMEIDVIRGFALFGIFLVNMPQFHSPDFIILMNGMYPERTGMDFWIDLFFQLFIQMKFFTIFSFLFGLGFYVFMSRAAQKGLNMTRLFTRRMIGLFAFGLIHLVFLWLGDILHLYAVGGLFLLLFYARKPGTILAWAFGFLFIYNALLSLDLLIPASVLESIQEETEQNSAAKIAEYVHVYENAGYLEWVSYRLETEVGPILTAIPLTLIPVFALFLLGLYAGKIGLFQKNKSHFALIKNVQIVSLLFSIPLVIVLGMLKLNMLHAGVYKIDAAQLLTSLSGASLSFFYIASLFLLLQKEFWKKRLRPLGYAGQMALTNYLFQTVVCFIVFIGLGYYGDIRLAAGTLLCLLIFTVQIFFSRFWLSKYRFGPIEWIWRSFTYGEFQPLKKAAVSETDSGS